MPEPAASATDSGTLSERVTVPVEAELRATVMASLPPTPTPDAPGGVPWSEVDVGVLPLSGGEGDPPLWAVFTQGRRTYDPDQGHFVAVYTHDGQDWQELDRVVLTSCAEYVGSESLAQVKFEPSRTWLELQSGAGAHGGCYDLLSFDGESLRFEASNSHSSPGAGWVEDLDGDGSPEVVLDLTETYVFCYACGLRYPRFSVLRWDGERLAEVQLSALPQAAPTELRSLNIRAVELAQAGLWKDAQEVIGQALTADVQDPIAEATVAWNGALIGLHAKALADQVGGGVYPLLENAFYGDYDAAVGAMRPYSVEEIWGPETPLVVGTAAEGWEFELSTWISQATNLALRAQPDLAPALFLRGWGAHLRTPGDAKAVADVERAAELAPNDPLFAQSAAYLQVPISVAPPPQPIAYRPLPAEACYELGQALMQTLGMTVTQAEVPVEDTFPGMVGTGCRSTAKGTGVDLRALISVSADIKSLLEERGWDEDPMYAADGPTGTAAGFQQRGDICFLSVDWSPSDAADCPPDRPISACDLAPEQWLRTIILTCATQGGAAGRPIPTVMPSETSVPTPVPTSVVPMPVPTSVRTPTPARSNRHTRTRSRGGVAGAQFASWTRRAGSAVRAAGGRVIGRLAGNPRSPAHQR